MVVLTLTGANFETNAQRLPRAYVTAEHQCRNVKYIGAQGPYQQLT